MPRRTLGMRPEYRVVNPSSFETRIMALKTFLVHAISHCRSDIAEQKSELQHIRILTCILCVHPQASWSPLAFSQELRQTAYQDTQRRNQRPFHSRTSSRRKGAFHCSELSSSQRGFYANRFELCHIPPVSSRMQRVQHRLTESPHSLSLFSALIKPPVS